MGHNSVIGSLMWTGSKTARVTGQARGETGIDPDKK
jgi:hypothetical protein